MTLERGTLIVRDRKKGGGQLILVRIGEKPAGFEVVQKIAHGAHIVAAGREN